MTACGGESTEGTDTGSEEGSDTRFGGGAIQLSVDVCSLGADAMPGFLEADEVTPVPSEGEGGPVCTWNTLAGYGVEVSVASAEEDEPVDIYFADDKVEVPDLGAGSAYTETAQQAFWRRGEVSVYAKILNLTAGDPVTVIARAIDADLQAAGY